MAPDFSVHGAPDVFTMQELIHGRSWTDEPLVVPPAGDVVAACLEAVAMPCGHVLGVEPVRGQATTAGKVAVNTVMAACAPRQIMNEWTTDPEEISRPARARTADRQRTVYDGTDRRREDDGMTLRVLDPTWEESAAGFAPAPRLPVLEGSTVGIISNGKKGTAPFFAHLVRLLGDRHGVKEVVLRVKRSFSAPAERALMDEAAQWSAAIAGVGD